MSTAGKVFYPETLRDLRGIGKDCFENIQCKYFLVNDKHSSRNSCVCPQTPLIFFSPLLVNVTSNVLRNEKEIFSLPFALNVLPKRSRTKV